MLSPNPSPRERSVTVQISNIQSTLTLKHITTDQAATCVPTGGPGKSMLYKENALKKERTSDGSYLT